LSKTCTINYNLIILLKIYKVLIYTLYDFSDKIYKKSILGFINLDNILKILTLISSIIGAYVWLFKNYYSKHLQEKIYRNEIIKSLNNKQFDEYYKFNIQKILKPIDSFYVNNRLIFIFSRHILIALLYTFLILLFFWLFYGESFYIFTENIFPTLNLKNRLIVFIFYLFLLFIIFAFSQISKNSNKINIFDKNFPETEIGSLMGISLLTFGYPAIIVDIFALNENVKNIFYIISGLALYISIFEFLLLLLLTIYYFIEKKLKKQSNLIFWSFLIIFTILIPINIKIKIIFCLFYFVIFLYIKCKNIGYGLNLLLAGLIALLFVYYYGKISINIFYFIGIFWIFLPFINAIFDFFSVKISIFFTKKILNDTNLLHIFWHILIDFLLAILLSFILFSLSFIFIYIILEYYLNVNVAFNEILKNNFSTYGWLFIIYFTTLIPTIILIVLAINWFVIKFFSPEKAIKNLKKYKKGEEYQLNSASFYLTNMLFIKFIFTTLFLVMIIKLTIYCFNLIKAFFY